MPAETDLGRLVRRYPTVPGQRPKIAAIQLSAAALLTVLAVAVLVAYFSAEEIRRPPLGAGVLVGAAALLIVMGVKNARAAHASRDEVFELYDGGLVHRRAAGTRTVPWAAIASAWDAGMTADEPFPGPGDGRGRIWGFDTNCVLKLRDGGTIVITDVTDGAHHLARAVTAAVPSGAPTQADWNCGARIGVLIALLILALMALTWALVL